MDTTSNTFIEDIKKGLSAPLKNLSSKYLYDDRGTELFIEITKLDEYYLTRCELDIFTHQSKDIINSISHKVDEVIELGCGDGHKTKVLLEAILKQNSTIFKPVDISGLAIDKISTLMKSEFPELKVEGHTGDYFEFLEKSAQQGTGTRLFLFLGSNIGNFSTESAKNFLSQIGKHLKKDDYLLIGMDLKKDIQVMQCAYNDSKNVTKEFNYNLLDRINKDLGANFSRDKFVHHGFYNPWRGAMESFLVAKEAHTVKFERINFEANFDTLEPIHIENSHKYSIRDIEGLCEHSGFEIKKHFTDSKNYFVDSLWRKPN